MDFFFFNRGTFASFVLFFCWPHSSKRNLNTFSFGGNSFLSSVKEGHRFAQAYSDKAVHVLSTTNFYKCIVGWKSWLLSTYEQYLHCLEKVNGNSFTDCISSGKRIAIKEPLTKTCIKTEAHSLVWYGNRMFKPIMMISTYHTSE